MNPLLLTFDLEEFEKAGDKGFDIGYNGGRVVQKLLEKTGVHATFFVTARFYLRYPDFVAELSECHEIAFHGLDHHDDYQVLSEDEAVQKLTKGKTHIEKGLNLNIEGFRAPRMRPPSYAVLKKTGFVYSSSLHPTYVPGRYNQMTAPRSPFVREGVLEIPVSVAPLVRLPFSWVWFRQLGVTYAKVIASMVNHSSSYLCIYFHPWEFISLQGYGLAHSRNTGKKMEFALEKFLNWLSSKTTPMKMGEFAKKFMKENREGHDKSIAL